MAIITDPDNLDRFQVLVDYENEFISIRAVDTSAPIISPKPTGQQFANDYVLTDGGIDFDASGVASGASLVIVEGPNINHWTITGVDVNGDPGSIGVETGVLGPFSNNYTGQYAVYPAAGGAVTDGATLQAIYSFLKEEWKTQFSSGDAGALTDLIQFIFPLESITREQFEIGGTTHSNWDWKDDTTRNLIRTAGWNKLDADGNVKQQYAGIVTLGTLDSDTQVYYQQVNSTSGTDADPKNFVLLGAVNQAILFVDNDNSIDLSQYLKLFARKKARTYPKSEIADIGVTDLENIVNRFPLSHVSDPAIVLSDGALAGNDGSNVFQETSEVFSASDGSVTAQAGSQQEQTFTFTSASSNFSASGIRPKDVLITGAGTPFEIVSVGTTTVDCLQEPGVDNSALSSVPFSVRTRIVSNYEIDGKAETTGTPHTTGLFTSTSVNFETSGVVVGNVLAVLDAGANGEVRGVYDIIGVTGQQLTVNTTDQSWENGPYTNLDFEVYDDGMYLQYKNIDATPLTAAANTTLTATSIQRDEANFETSGYVVGGIVKLGSSTVSANDGSYLITGIVTTTNTNDTLQIDGTLNTSTNPDTAVAISGQNGFLRAPQNTTYSYNWRLFGNNGTLAQCFQWIQKALRRGASTVLEDGQFRPVADIDNSSGIFRGDVTDLLMSFASPNGTTLNMFIDNLNGDDANNVTFEDILGVGRTNAFIVSVTLALNANITNDTSNKVTAFFVNDDAGSDLGNDFDTPDAIIIQDRFGQDVSSEGNTTNVTFQYDFDNNNQRGAGSAGSDVPIVAVAIGTSGAQWVLSSGTFSNVNTFSLSLVAALERNYSNPA
jgi:hypothetical protein